MMKILSVGKYGDVEVFPVNKNLYFEPGMIGRLNQDGTCGLSNGFDINGVIDDIYTYEHDSTADGKIRIWNIPFLLIETDKFDITQPYLDNSPLYVSECGFLTSENQLKTRSVAKVDIPPTVIEPTLKFIWNPN